MKYTMDEELAIGAKSGCLTVIGGLGDYQEAVEKEMEKLDDKTRKEILASCKRVHPSQVKNQYLLRTLSLGSEKKYKCQCKCGQIHYLNKSSFEQKEYRDCGIGCALIKEREQKRKDNCLRRNADDYDVDYTNTIFESLEVLECINDNYERVYLPKRGRGICIIHRLYKCRCYLCGKEYDLVPSDFTIYKDEHGSRAKDGYYSRIYCGCHKTSSFQWRTVDILQKHNVKYRVEFAFPELYGVAEKKLLRFDFAIFDSEDNIKCLIECQGEQHFRPIEEFGGKKQYEVQAKNDELKRSYATKHMIQLIEIPYTCDTYEKEIDYLKKSEII